VINEAWPLRPLGELFEIGAGKTMSAAGRDGKDKTPFLRTSNVLWDEIDLTTVDGMAIPERELPGKLLRPGDLLVCEGGEIGRAAIWNGDVELMSFQNHLHRLRPLADDVEPRFYVYFLQSAFTQLGIFEGAANKTTIPNLSRNRLAAFDVPHPRRDEQQAVVATLALVRDAIRLHDQTLVQKLKRAVMRQLFTRGLRGEAQKETEIGPVPESWSVAPIGRYTKLSQYGLSIRGNATGRYPILRMNCQEDGRVVLRDLQYVELDHATAQSFRVNRDDLLFNRTNSYELVGRTAIVEGDIDAVFASYLIRLSIDDERLLPRYLNYFLNWDFAQSELKKLASRAVGQANINATKLSGFTVPVPTIDEQREIVAILDAIDRKIGLHREKRTVLDELFKALLHKLMTGEIRVGDLDLSALAPARVAEAAQ
jgi:type I restriction enzyme S subunit